MMGIQKAALDYRVVFESAPVGLEYYDRDGILIDINENALRIYGCTDKKHLLESRICLYDNPNYKSQVKSEADRYRPCICNFYYDFDLLQKENYYLKSTRSGRILIENKIEPILNEKGEIEGTVIVTRDITEEYNLNERFDKLFRERNAIVEMLPVGLAVYDKDGYQQFINPALAAIFGVQDIQTHLSKHINLFDDPIIPDHLKEQVRNSDFVEASLEYSLQTAAKENYFETGLSESIYLNCQVRKIKDENGGVQAMMLLISDDTIYARKNQELEEAYRNLKLTLDAGDIAAWTYNIEEEMFYSILGDAIAGDGFSLEDNRKRLHPDDHQMQTDLLGAIARGEKEKGITIFRYLSPSGEYRYYESHIIPRKKNGKIIGLTGTQKDVTEWSRLTEQLKERNKQNNLILNNINSGLVFISPDYRVIWENVSSVFPYHSSGKQYYEAGELCYKNNFNINAPCKNCATKRAIVSKQIEHAEILLEGHTFEVYANPVLNEQNEIDGIILRIDDITHRKQILGELETAKSEALVAKEKAEQSDKLKSAFLANMSHEIRTPLNAIVGFSELLYHTENKEDRADFWQIISTNNALLLTLINDILDLSKVEAGYVDLVKKEFDITQLFGELHAIYAQKMNPNTTFINESPEQTSLVNLDKGRLNQVMTNFINNAIKFTKAGSIRIGYTICNHRLRIYCSDTGIGIRPEQQEQVFGRFEKLDTFAQGTGLGLSICKAIVDAQGGTIGIDSEVNKGSTFWAELPV